MESLLARTRVGLYGGIRTPCNPGSGTSPARGQFRAEIGGEGTGEPFGLFGAVVERDAVIGVAAEEQPRVPGRALLDPGDALAVAEQVLRDRPVPAHDVMKDRRRRDAQRQPHL